MQKISIKKLYPDPRNANECEEKTLQAIQEHIQRTGQYQALTVRPHPQRKGMYMLLDGHHRKQVLENLGYKEVDCQVWELSETEAEIALITLNRLRGADNPRKRAELIDSLLKTFSKEALSHMIPESKAEIDSLVALIKLDTSAMEKALKEQMAAEKQALPVPFGFMVPADMVDTVHQALGIYPTENKNEAFVALCKAAIKYSNSIFFNKEL